MIAVLQPIAPLHVVLHSSTFGALTGHQYHNEPLTYNNLIDGAGNSGNIFYEYTDSHTNFEEWNSDNLQFTEWADQYDFETGGGNSWFDDTFASLLGSTADGDGNFNQFSSGYQIISLEEGPDFRYESGSSTILIFGQTVQNNAQWNSGNYGASGQIFSSGSSFSDADFEMSWGFDGVSKYSLSRTVSGTTEYEWSSSSENDQYDSSSNTFHSESSSARITSSYSSSDSFSGVITGAFGPFWWGQFSVDSTYSSAVFSTEESATTFTAITGFVSTLYKTYIEGHSTLTTTTTSNTTVSTSVDDGFTTFNFINGVQNWNAPGLLTGVFLDPDNSYDYKTIYCPDAGEILFVPIPDVVNNIQEDTPYAHSDLYYTLVADFTSYPDDDIGTTIYDLVSDFAGSNPQLQDFKSYSMSQNSDIGVITTTRTFMGPGTTSTFTFIASAPDVTSTTTFTNTVQYQFYVVGKLPMETASSTRAYDLPTATQEYTSNQLDLAQDDFFAVQTNEGIFISSSWDQHTVFAQMLNADGNMSTTVFYQNVVIAAGTLIQPIANPMLLTSTGNTLVTGSYGFADQGSTGNGGRTELDHTGEQHTFIDPRDGNFLLLYPQMPWWKPGYQIAPFVDKYDPVYEGVGAIYPIVYPALGQGLMGEELGGLVPYNFFYRAKKITSIFGPLTTFIDITGYSNYAISGTNVGFDTDGNSFTSYDPLLPVTSYTILWDWLTSTADPYLNLSVTTNVGDVSDSFSFDNKLYPLGGVEETVSFPLYSVSTGPNDLIGRLFSQFSLAGIAMGVDPPGNIVGGQPRFDADETLYIQGDYTITQAIGDASFTWVTHPTAGVETWEVITDNLYAIKPLDVTYFSLGGYDDFFNPPGVRWGVQVGQRYIY